MAVTFGWKGMVDTRLRFSDFYRADHTIVVWFLLQYPFGYEGPILSANGNGNSFNGNYFVGQGDFNSQAAPNLVARIQETTRVYTGQQKDWRWCENCQGLFFAMGQDLFGSCPAGGQHKKGASGDYHLASDAPGFNGQDDWRWCSKCSGLFFAGGQERAGSCPAPGGGQHEKGRSGDYVLAHNAPGFSGQRDWRWCHKCSGLFYSGGKELAGKCPAPGSGPHEKKVSGDYTLAQKALNEPLMKVGQWYQLAVVREKSEIKLLLDGQILGSPLTLTGREIPSGTLCLGKSGPLTQFYGMMAELAVYTRALTSTEIQTRFRNRTRLQGNEQGLLAGWLFSPTPQSGLPPRMLRPFDRSGQSFLVANSANWSGSDLQLIPLPEHHFMELPFLTGEAWICRQGYASGRTHSGVFAFCLDFQIADKVDDWTAVYPNGSHLAPIYSTDDGMVTLVANPPDLHEENQVQVKNADGFTRTYQHLLADSAKVKEGQQISGGPQIARICRDWRAFDSNIPHLHFGIIDFGDGPPNQTVFVTAPAAFSNYEVRNPDRSWSVIPKGIPLDGQVVRRRGGRDDWHRLGDEQIWSNPAAVSWGLNRIDVFARGTDNTLQTKSWNGQKWDDWRQLGSEQIASAPAACSWGAGRLDVFARGTDGALYTKSWNGKKWDNWHQLGAGKILSAPAAVSWGPNRIDVFAQGSDNTLQTKSWNGQKWDDWRQLGSEQIASAPAVSSWGPDRLDVFARGTDGALYTKSWNGKKWDNWHQLGAGKILSAPASASRAPNRIDVFAQGTDNTIYTKSWNGQKWDNWHQFGREEITSGPAVSSWGPDRLDVFARGTDGTLRTKSWDGR